MDWLSCSAFLLYICTQALYAKGLDCLRLSNLGYLDPGCMRGCVRDRMMAERAGKEDVKKEHWVKDCPKKSETDADCLGVGKSKDAQASQQKVPRWTHTHTPSSSSSHITAKTAKLPCCCFPVTLCLLVLPCVF